jgi:hypothetical protein
MCNHERPLSTWRKTAILRNEANKSFIINRYYINVAYEYRFTSRTPSALLFIGNHDGLPQGIGTVK